MILPVKLCADCSNFAIIPLILLIQRQLNSHLNKLQIKFRKKKSIHIQHMLLIWHIIWYFLLHLSNYCTTCKIHNDFIVDVFNFNCMYIDVIISRKSHNTFIHADMQAIMEKLSIKDDVNNFILLILCAKYSILPHDKRKIN